MGFGFAYGHGIRPPGRLGAGGRAIMLVGNAVEESSPAGTLVGLFSILNPSGLYAFTLTDAGPGAYFSVADQLDNTCELHVAIDLDAGAPVGATKHITVQADNGVDPVLSWSGDIVITPAAYVLSFDFTDPRNAVLL